MNKQQLQKELNKANKKITRLKTDLIETQEEVDQVAKDGADIYHKFMEFGQTVSDLIASNRVARISVQTSQYHFPRTISYTSFTESKTVALKQYVQLQTSYALGLKGFHKRFSARNLRDLTRKYDIPHVKRHSQGMYIEEGMIKHVLDSMHDLLPLWNK